MINEFLEEHRIFEVKGQGGISSCPYSSQHMKWCAVYCLNLEVSSSILAAVRFWKV